MYDLFLFCKQTERPFLIFRAFKGQLISRANCRAVKSSKKRTNEIVSTSMRRVFVSFLEEIEDSTKTFRNYLTFSELLK